MLGGGGNVIVRCAASAAAARAYSSRSRLFTCRQRASLYSAKTHQRRALSSASWFTLFVRVFGNSGESASKSPGRRRLASSPMYLSPKESIAGSIGCTRFEGKFAARRPNAKASASSDGFSKHV